MSEEPMSSLPASSPASDTPGSQAARKAAVARRIFWGLSIVMILSFAAHLAGAAFAPAVAGLAMTLLGPAVVATLWYDADVRLEQSAAARGNEARAVAAPGAAPDERPMPAQQALPVRPGLGTGDHHRVDPHMSVSGQRSSAPSSALSPVEAAQQAILGGGMEDRFKGGEGRQYAVAWFDAEGRHARRGADDLTASPKVCLVLPRDARAPKGWRGVQEQLVPVESLHPGSAALENFFADFRDSWAAQIGERNAAVALRRQRIAEAAADGQAILAAVEVELTPQPPAAVLARIAEAPAPARPADAQPAATPTPKP